MNKNTAYIAGMLLGVIGGVLVLLSHATYTLFGIIAIAALFIGGFLVGAATEIERDRNN